MFNREVLSTSKDSARQKSFSREKRSESYFLFIWVNYKLKISLKAQKSYPKGVMEAPRVNASMLKQYVGRLVCLVARISEVNVF